MTLAILGFLAAAVSATQWSLVPWYTTLEAGGFAVLGTLGAVLAVRQFLSRRGPARPVIDDLVPPATVAAPRTAPLAGVQVPADQR